MTGVATHSLFGMNIGEHFEKWFAIGSRSSLVAFILFTGGHAQVVGPDKVAAMTGQTIPVGRFTESVSVLAVTVAATLDVTSVAAFLEKLCINLAPGLCRKATLRFPCCHDPVEKPVVPLVAGSTAAGPVPGGRWIGQRPGTIKMTGQTGEFSVDAGRFDDVADRAILSRQGRADANRQKADDGAECLEAHDGQLLSGRWDLWLKDDR